MLRQADAHVQADLPAFVSGVIDSNPLRQSHVT
jgi:hypothetical protein